MFKITIPSAIPIAGRNYTVKKFNGSGGRFSCSNELIEIGINCSKQKLLETIVHEISEAILAERNMRYALEYSITDDKDYRFVFDHNEFEQYCKDFSHSLSFITKRSNMMGKKKKGCK